MKAKIVPPPSHPYPSPGTLWRRKDDAKGRIYLAVQLYGGASGDKIHLYDTANFDSVWSSGTDAPFGFDGAKAWEYAGKLEISNED